MTVNIAITAGGKLAKRSALDVQAAIVRAGYAKDTVRDITARFAEDATGFAETLVNAGIVPVFETTQARDTREEALRELSSLLAG